MAEGPIYAMKASHPQVLEVLHYPIDTVHPYVRKRSSSFKPEDIRNLYCCPLKANLRAPFNFF